MDTGRFHSEEGWLEESLWASESLVADGDDLEKDVRAGVLMQMIITCPSGSS